jgi:hypothetical protein
MYAVYYTVSSQVTFFKTWLRTCHSLSRTAVQKKDPYVQGDSGKPGKHTSIPSQSNAEHHEVSNIFMSLNNIIRRHITRNKRKDSFVVK